jgi:hypothetical protein
MTKAKSGFNFVRFYFTIVSIISVLGCIVAYGIAGYQALVGLLISDEEYIAGNHYHYDLQQCEHQDTLGIKSQAPVEEQDDKNGTGAEQRSIQEVYLCKQEVTTRVINQRRYDKKQSII